MSSIKAVVAIIGFATAFGCTSAGPFITNISSAGDGRVVVEKCMAKFNMWTGTLSNDECRDSTIKIDPARTQRRR